MRSVVTVKLVNGLAAQICSVGGAARVGAIRVSTPMRTWKFFQAEDGIRDHLT